MVHEDGPVARPRARTNVARAQAALRPGELRKGLHQLARKPSRLDHLAPTLVGPSDSRLVHKRRRSDRRAIGSRGARASGYGGTDSRPGRARHVVLIGALAVLNPGLAQRNRGSENVLSDFG